MMTRQTTAQAGVPERRDDPYAERSDCRIDDRNRINRAFLSRGGSVGRSKSSHSWRASRISRSSSMSRSSCSSRLSSSGGSFSAIRVYTYIGYCFQPFDYRGFSFSLSMSPCASHVASSSTSNERTLFATRSTCSASRSAGTWPRSSRYCRVVSHPVRLFPSSK